jgi:ribosomal protein L24
VCRHFRLGDFVEVFRGDHKGVEGFVIRVGDNEAELYVQPNPEEASYKAEGYQVSTIKLTRCAQ